MSVKIVGSSSGNVAEVNASNEVKIAPTQTEASVGLVGLVTENSKASDPAGRTTHTLEASPDYRLRVGADQVLFNTSFENATTGSYRHLVTEAASTMTSALGTGRYTLNSAAATASGNHINIRTYRTFPLFGSYPTYGEVWARTTNGTASNKILELGFGYAATTAAPTDGAFFRWLLDGSFRCYVNYGGTELPSAAITPPTDNADHHFVVTSHNDMCDFWIDDALVAQISVGNNYPSPTASSYQPVFARVYNSGIASLGATLAIGFINVSLGDMNATRPWPVAMASMGLNSVATPSGSAALGQTTNWANSAVPATGTLANITPSYTTLGGQFLWAAVAGAETDFPLFGYTVTAGTNAIPGRNLNITGCDITMMSTGAANSATVPTVVQFGIAVGSTAGSLATSDAAATRSPKRYFIGSIQIPTSAVVGAAGDRDIHVNFPTPFVAEPGTLVHGIVKIVSGAATASQTIRGTWGFNGYFD